MELNSLIMIDILSEDYGENFRLTINNWKKNKIKRWRDLERKSGACLPRDTLARAIMLVSADIISTTHVWERGAPSGRKERRKEGRVNRFLPRGIWPDQWVGFWNSKPNLKDLSHVCWHCSNFATCSSDPPHPYLIV